MNLSKLLTTKTGRVVMSVLLGFGLATIFRAVCRGSGCQVIKAPPLAELEKPVKQADGKCVAYDRVPIDCAVAQKAGKKIVQME
jgi:hypothetical protein